MKSAIKINPKSSNIKEIVYYKETEDLIITFNSRQYYQYSKVPREIVLKLLKKECCDRKGNHSIGATFIQLIKDKYECIKY